MRLERTYSFGTHDSIKRQNIKETNSMSAGERFATITFLREQYYGPEATTGRVQRVYTAFRCN